MCPFITREPPPICHRKTPATGDANPIQSEKPKKENNVAICVKAEGYRSPDGRDEACGS